MSVPDHSRPGRAGKRSGHVRHAPKAEAITEHQQLRDKPLPVLISHNRNSSYACDTAGLGNERLTLLALTFGGCYDERHFKRFPRINTDISGVP
jgi:hypothetical protein